jgi:copper homeostasis protein
LTFHRAFDRTPDLDEALEAVIQTGADCLLTSGGAPNVLTGVNQLKTLVIQAGNSPPESDKKDGKAEILEADVRTAVRLMQGHFAAETD